jgi:hypothetical protein
MLEQSYNWSSGPSLGELWSLDVCHAERHLPGLLLHYTRTRAIPFGSCTLNPESNTSRSLSMQAESSS